jgi:hypothetical protein
MGKRKNDSDAVRLVDAGASPASGGACDDANFVTKVSEHFASRFELPGLSKHGTGLSLNINQPMWS